MIAGTHSGVGKTTLATAIMSMLSRCGLKVQPYKVGPDYIDPGFHQVATGRVSRNLDIFLVGEEAVPELFTRSASDADIAVIEGVMGLYDGIGARDKGSSAHVAHLLRCPVLLVVDARSMAHSVAALVWGYANVPGAVPIAGVILNQVGSDRHYQILKEAIRVKTGIPVLGGFNRDQQLHMPERYMGLVPSTEKNVTRAIDLLGGKATRVLSPGEIINIARGAPAMHVPEKIFGLPSRRPVRLGLVRDNAFHFYYQDGLDVLAALGAELVPCSALADKCLPPALDGLYIGGGFPEAFMDQLSANKSFKVDLKSRVDAGMPLYAECGGLMYLCQSISTSDGTGRPKTHPGVGILPARCRVEQKRMALGYVHATALGHNILFKQGDRCRGHEFHYTTVKDKDLKAAFRIEKKAGGRSRHDGHAHQNVLATYLHLHFAGAIEAARRFLDSCADFRAATGGK